MMMICRMTINATLPGTWMPYPVSDKSKEGGLKEGVQLEDLTSAENLQQAKSARESG